MIKIKHTKSFDYQFVITSKAGQVLLNSITFNSKKEINKTVASLAEPIDSQIKFERKTSSEGRFLFQLKNGNGDILGNSGLYTSEAGMENGIKNLKNNLIIIE